MFSACQLHSWLTQSKSVVTVSSASIFAAGTSNGLHLCEFYKTEGKFGFLCKSCELNLRIVFIIINLTLKH